ELLLLETGRQVLCLASAAVDVVEPGAQLTVRRCGGGALSNRRTGHKGCGGEGGQDGEPSQNQTHDHASQGEQADTDGPWPLAPPFTWMKKLALTSTRQALMLRMAFNTPA